MSQGSCAANLDNGVGGGGVGVGSVHVTPPSPQQQVGLAGPLTERQVTATHRGQANGKTRGEN